MAKRVWVMVHIIYINSQFYTVICHYVHYTIAFLYPQVLASSNISKD